MNVCRSEALSVRMVNVGPFIAAASPSLRMETRSRADELSVACCVFWSRLVFTSPLVGAPPPARASLQVPWPGVACVFLYSSLLS